MSMIHQRLQNSQFRFIKLKAKTKIPYEKDWQNTKNYQYDMLNDHEGNIGVIGGYGNLIMLDADNKEFAVEIKERLPKTFVVQTGSGGNHFYLISDYKTNHVFKGEVGELRANNYQVVIPGCIHPNGNLYEVIDDNPIAEIPAEKLREIIKPYLRAEVLKEDKDFKPKEEDKDTSRSGREYKELIKLIGRGNTKREVFEAMMVYSKWQDGSPQYRELSYEKARDIVINSREQRGGKDNWNIWELQEDKKGKFVNVFSHTLASNCVTANHHILTVGEDRKKMYCYDDGVYRLGGEDLILKKIEALTKGRVKCHQIKEVVGGVQRQTFTDRIELIQKDINLVCVENGILNLKTMKLQQHTPKLIFTQKIPHKFDKEADCPNIKHFLKEILTANDVMVLQEYCGSILLRDFRFKKALLFVGDMDSGKTTLIKTIINFIGEQNISSKSLHRIVTDKFSTHSLYNKLLNIYDDLSTKDLQDVGEFKIVTGGGWTSCEKKFGDSFEFQNHAKFIFATNKISELKEGNDTAYYGRWLIMFFNNVFSKGNNNTKLNLIDTLTTPEEMSGFLNWCLEGLNRLIENGNFSFALEPEETREIMEIGSSPISAFVFDCLEQVDGEYETKDDLYAAYSKYIEIKGFARVSKEMFGRQLPTKAGFVLSGQRTIKNKKTVCWLNVIIKPITKVKAFNTFISTIRRNEYSNTFHIYNVKNSIESIDKWDERSKAWIPCEFDTEKGICGNSPCNESSNGKHYCKAHFESKQKDETPK